ncbi:NAD(P)/FAD-dependent oxidoreductase [Methanomassiliicoccus luminyensis]|uniref:NAD(P)/FAD-dependent oxidoreductase n=1 Tax=Methanomassiliicoccus luminyensis TaxID=1080712 RepID=UPI000A90E7CD|nr:FAD-dependent oxidoreductase [Methanomassiliicoccus luminyensis]
MASALAHVMNTEADVTIVGLGPAGLQAAIHAARKKVRTVAIGKSAGSALNRAEVENYLGVPHAEGAELLRIGREQAAKFGAELLEEEVTKAERDGDMFVITTDHDRTVRTKALVLALGVARNKLGVPGEKDYLGKGVSYCASCDGGFFRGRPVAVIGEESEAAESAILMTEIASKVYWVNRGLKVSEHLMEKARKTTMEIVEGKPVKIAGGDTVTGLELEGGRKLDVNGVFIALGAKGSMEIALELGIMPDPSGKIPVNEDMRTEVEKVYACGDVTGLPYQVARAVGQGCIAGDNAAKAVRQEKA